MEWFKQEEKNIMDHHPGSTVLIKFNDTLNGITADNDETVDISWIRIKEKIHATSGGYTADEIKEWAVI